MTNTAITTIAPPPWMAAWQPQPESDLGTPGQPGQPGGTPIRYADSVPTGVEPGPAPSGPAAAPRAFDQGRYWVGAALTAAIAALTGVIAMVVATGVFDVRVQVPGSANLLNVGTYGFVIGALALVAALLFDGMAHAAPRPTLYFRWLLGLITALAAIVPFTAATALSSQAVLAGANILVGAIILALVPVAAVKNQPTA